MITQYPYYLWIVTPSAATVDANGNFAAGTDTYTAAGRCRDTFSGSGKVVNVGGQQYTCDHVVYAPQGVDVQEGAEIVVTEDAAMAKVRCRFVVRLCHINQLHTRIYG